MVGALMAATLSADAASWKTGTTDNGRISVRSNISSQNVGGSEKTVIEYVASTVTEGISVERYVSLFGDVANHKRILNEKDVRVVSAASEPEKLLYYYFDAPWPVPDSDAVVRMVFTRDQAQSIYSLSAMPARYPRQGVRRFELYDVTYAFKDLGNGKVEATTTARVAPPITIPSFMLSSAFPGAAADGLRNLVNLARGK